MTSSIPSHGIRNVLLLTLLPVLTVAVVMWKTLPTMTTFDNRQIVLVGPQGQEIRINAEIARTQEEQQKGLMFREKLARNAGMLFIFTDSLPTVRSFWMKNTRIPLDILFFNEERELVSTATMQPCRADPCTLYSSGLPAVFALEVNAGFVKKYEIAQGWHLQY